ncbi:hypothetical protein UFOVP1290_131 [uncultured Caudovirales phage]|uniref:Uncharacterized protein n=1 Tax=uncultured Caudovirales phage TaxID=2100421 RepID=A0A6J5RSP8_9CAUD|nr:hypothetical protein UFOVP1290_131 [uncultured Caudovirales phage]
MKCPICKERLSERGNQSVGYDFWCSNNNCNILNLFEPYMFCISMNNNKIIDYHIIININNIWYHLSSDKDMLKTDLSKIDMSHPDSDIEPTVSSINKFMLPDNYENLNEYILIANRLLNLVVFL